MMVSELRARLAGLPDDAEVIVEIETAARYAPVSDVHAPHPQSEDRILAAVCINVNDTIEGT